MGNLKSGAYKKIRLRPKKPSRLIHGFGLKLQYYGQILHHYITSEYNPDSPEGAKDLIPAIALMDKLANTSLKLLRTAKSISATREIEEPSLADLILDKDNDNDDR